MVDLRYTGKINRGGS